MDKETGLPEGASTYSAGTSTDPWTEVRIEVPAERIDAAGDIAHMTARVHDRLLLRFAGSERGDCRREDAVWRKRPGSVLAGTAVFCRN